MKVFRKFAISIAGVTLLPLSTTSRSAVDGECMGPYDGNCLGRIEWMLQGNWQNDAYTSKGVDGSRCSIQKFLHLCEGQGVTGCPDTDNPNVDIDCGEEEEEEDEPIVVDDCMGPFNDNCQGRIDWMLEGNWQNDEYTSKGVDGSQCSIQKFLHLCEGQGVTGCPDTDNPIVDIVCGEEEEEEEPIEDDDTDCSLVDGVVIRGRSICVDRAKFGMKGVNWNPVPVGGTTPFDIQYSAYIDGDGALMQQAGINVIRTYEPLLDTVVLDKLYALGIRVINTVYVYGGDDPNNVPSRVNAVKNHPAMLMWAIGNEWNYNGLYVGKSFDECASIIGRVASLIKQNDDNNLPISTVYGNMPSQGTLTRPEFADIDVWGLNVYSGISFGGLFNDWAQRSTKPMYLGEFGADAWNANINAEDEDSQALATTRLTQEIIDNWSVCVGGVIFEFADEWYKAGNPDVHDNGGVAPGGGPYPDNTFNEEYWGLTDVYRNPRKAYYAYAEMSWVQ